MAKSPDLLNAHQAILPFNSLSQACAYLSTSGSQMHLSSHVSCACCRFMCNCVFVSLQNLIHWCSSDYCPSSPNIFISTEKSLASILRLSTTLQYLQAAVQCACMCTLLPWHDLHLLPPWLTVALGCLNPSNSLDFFEFPYSLRGQR